MRILLLGATGMLGHQVLAESVRRHHQVWALSRRVLPEHDGATVLGGLDARDPSRLPSWMDEIAPHVVINAVGLVKQRPEATDIEDLMRVNAWFPRSLEFFLEPRGIRLIHISTDCVFDGRRGSYRETELPNATDAYGLSKALGEVSGELSLTLRTSIIGPERETQFGLYEWFRNSQGLAVKGYAESWFSGVTTLYLSRLIVDLIERYPMLHGIYQVASAPISKYTLLTAIRDRFGWDTEIERDPTVRINRVLDGGRFTRTTDLKVPPWSAMIEELYQRTNRTANIDRRREQ